ncbi:MAG: alcohol dehydrogenase catalytic domain-containing protein [Peptococcaceae bacterium]|jgi:L-iditol 2-dehydrogenase|nr:alcohol dehydrogenase catalytic domain-containing protein [Peptococcaceae bacterium]MDH7524953.1 alcohol dehydrogenase catalytic domain-containing protein [Peptococcaceae bacterium]
MCPKPSLKPGEILIRMKCVGICGSDLHVYHGKLPFVKYPIVQGHEGTGVVVEANDCKKIKVGDRVIVRPQKVCGRCDPCRNGSYHICDNLQIMGIHTPGLSSEYVAVPEKMAVIIPEDIPLDVGTMIEPLSVAVHAVNLVGSVENKNVLIIGAGTVGNLVAQVAKAKDAKVMITGRTDYRLEYAKQLGIHYCINDSKEDVGNALQKVFGQGADVTFECIGVESSVNQSFAYCRKGGKAVITGVIGEKLSIAVGIIQDKELTVYGSQMYREQDYLESISLIQRGKVALAPLITAHFSMKEYLEAYRFILSGSNKVMKVIINIGEG